MDDESNEYYSMRFPRENKTFSKFNNKSMEEQESIIKLGLVMLESGKNGKITLNSEEWASKLDKIKKKNEEKQKELNENIDHQINKIQKLKETNREELRDGVAYAVNIEKSKSENTLNGYKEKLKEQDYKIDELRKETWIVRENCRDEYDKKLEEIRIQEREKTDKREYEYRTTMEELSNNMVVDADRCKVPSNKGKEGETNVHKFLVMALPKSDIEDVSQKGGAGDLIIQDASKNIMVEVKNYDSANVKTSEVNKFKKDMQNNNFTGGIFLSMNRGICNIDNWTIDTVGGKPVIYLCNAADKMDNIITAYEVIKKLSEINIDWTITEKLKTIQDFVKQNSKEKKKKLKVITDFSRDITKLINNDDQKLNTLIESLSS